MRFLWLRTLARSLFGPPRRRARITPPHRRLFVEEVEPRITPAPLIHLSLDNATSAIAGSAITITETVSVANAAAANVDVKDTLPFGFNFVSQTQVSGTAFTLGYSGGTVSDTLSSMSAGTSAVFDIIATISSSTANNTTLTNSGMVTSTSFLDPSSVLSASLNTISYTFGPISVTNPGNQTKTEGNSVSLSISATDSTAGTLHYAADNLPPGLSINPSSGSITGTVAVGASADSPYTTTVIASDGSFSGQTTFTYTISSPISLTNPGAQSNSEGGSVSLSATCTDTAGTPTFAAQGLPPGLAISTSSGAISGTVAAGAAASGPYSVTLTAADGTYSASQSFTWTISSGVTLVQPPDQTNTEGDSVSLALNASGSGTLVYGAVGLPPGLAISTSTGTISGTVAASGSLAGPYTVTVSVGNGSASASQSFTWNVNDPISIVTPANQTSNEGASVSLSISATDSSSGTLVYGALGLPGGLSISSSSGTISGTLSTGAAADSPYTITLLAEDGTYSNATSFNWTVNCPVTLTTPDDQSNNPGDAVSLSVVATGSGTLSYSATSLPNGLSINSSSGVISGTLSYGGTWEPTVTVGNGTYSTSASFNWDVSSPITITDSGPQAFNAGDAVSVPISATDTASGTLSYSGSSLPSGLSISSSSGLISGTISSSLSAGDYTSTITVTDSTNTAVDFFNWTIYPTSDVTITNPGNKSNNDGDSVSWSLSATDSSSGTLSYAAANLPPGLKINSSSGAITGTVAPDASLFSPYTTTVTATDGTYTDSQTFTWTVSGGGIAMSNPGTQTNDEGDSVSWSLANYSSSGLTLTYAAANLPPGLSLSASTGDITGTIALDAAQDSPYSVTLQAASGSYSVEQELTWTVNSPISITQPSDQTTAEGTTISTLSLSVSGGGTKHYTAEGLPPGLKINTGSGAITGTVAVGDAAGGPYDVTIVANDGTYTGSTSFTWNVTCPVTITTPADPTTNEGSSGSLSISASDSISGSTLYYAAQGLPPGLVMSATTGAISGTVTVGDAANGPYSVTIAANDGTYTAQTSFTWNINSPISITQPNDQTNNAGQSVSLSILASDATSGTLSYSASGLPSGLSINSSTGAITGTLSDGGFWSPTITVSDSTYSATVSFNWTVSSPIVISDPGDQANTIGATVSLTIPAVDNASGTLSYSASGLPTGLSINSSTGVISGTVSSGASTTTPYTPTISVTDSTHTAVDTFTWTIGASGTVVVTSMANQTNAVGDMLALPIAATDTANNPLIYSVTGLPTGLYLNPVTGLIFGTLPSSATSGSPYSVTVTAKDSASNTASQSFTWTINAAGTLLLTNPGDQTNSEGDSVSVAVSDTYTGSGTVHYVAFDLPPGLSISTSSGTISGTVALGAATSSVYTVTIVVNDSTYSAAQTFDWTITCPVTITAPADQANNEGDTVSLSISASDSSSGTLYYAALGLPAGLKMNASTGAITGTVAVGAAAYGPYSVTILAGDGTYSAEQSFNWTINSPITITVPDDQTNNEGDSVSLSLSASDSHSGTLVYTVLDLPPGLSVNPSSGAISGTVAIGASGIGSFSPTIIVNDGTYYSSTSFNWTINSPITITDPGNQVNVVGDTVSLPITAVDASSGTMHYAVSGLPAGLSVNTSSGAISGTVGSGATAIGSYTTTVTVSDGTYSAVDTFSWTISAAGTITLATPANQSNSEGDTVSLSISASGGGTKHYFAEGLPPGLKISPTSGSISGMVALDDAASGPYTVTVIATDGTNVATETFTWTVTSPVTISAIADQTNTESDSVSLSISASDSSSGTLKYAAFGLPAGLAINTSTGAITGTMALGAAAKGPFTVTVIAGDGTYSASLTFTWTITDPITMTQSLDQTNVEGDTVSLSMSATDSSSGTLKYSAVDLPPGLKINASTGAITGTVATGVAYLGSYAVTVTASDSTYSASQRFAISVASPISITDPGIQNFSVGQAISLQLQASGSGTLTFIAQTLPWGLTLSSSGLISGTLSNSTAAVGVFPSIIRVTNGSYSSSLPILENVLARVFGSTSVTTNQAIEQEEEEEEEEEGEDKPRKELVVHVKARVLFGAKDNVAADIKTANNIWKQADIQFKLDETVVEKKDWTEKRIGKTTTINIFSGLDNPAETLSAEEKALYKDDSDKKVVYAYFADGVANTERAGKFETQFAGVTRDNDSRVLIATAKHDAFFDGKKIYTSTPFKECLAHELGHVLGLKHVDDPKRLMYGGIQKLAIENKPIGTMLSPQEQETARKTATDKYS